VRRRTKKVIELGPEEALMDKYSLH